MPKAPGREHPVGTPGPEVTPRLGRNFGYARSGDGIFVGACSACVAAWSYITQRRYRSRTSVTSPKASTRESLERTKAVLVRENEVSSLIGAPTAYRGPSSYGREDEIQCVGGRTVARGNASCRANKSERPCCPTFFASRQAARRRTNFFLRNVLFTLFGNPRTL